MELTKKERLSFIYQLRILEALYPDEAVDFANHRTALENGYALHYSWMAEHISNEMSESECRQVLDILDMYRAISFSLSKLPDSDSLKTSRLAIFPGFDGNNEGAQMSYARYFIVDLERYAELNSSGYPRFNSHTPMLSIYEDMLSRWRSLPNKFELSREQTALVLGAK